MELGKFIWFGDDYRNILDDIARFASEVQDALVAEPELPAQKKKRTVYTQLSDARLMLLSATVSCITLSEDRRKELADLEARIKKENEQEREQLALQHAADIDAHIAEVAERDKRISDLEAEAARPLVDVMDIAAIPYKDAKGIRSCLRVLVYARKQEYPQPLVRQMFDAYRTLDRAYRGKRCGKKLAERISNGLAKRWLSLDTAYSFAKDLEMWSKVHTGNDRPAFLKKFRKPLRDKTHQNNTVAIIRTLRRHAAELSDEERQLLEVINRDHKGSYSAYREHVYGLLPKLPEGADPRDWLVELNKRQEAGMALREKAMFGFANLADFMPVPGHDYCL